MQGNDIVYRYCNYSKVEIVLVLSQSILTDNSACILHMYVAMYVAIHVHMLELRYIIYYIVVQKLYLTENISLN